MLIDLSNNSHKLECRNLSFTSTISRGPWYSRVCNPPLVAQLIKDISLEAHSGEVHGIVGCAGSGKSILLELIRSEGAGESTGTVFLDDHLLNKGRFSKLCSFVDFRVRYPQFLTVRDLLHYEIKLTIGSRMTSSQIEQRILSLMQEWELLGYGHEKLSSLSESARRRTILAIATAKDPILLIADDPIRNLEPLSSYQLMLCLQTYMKRHHRIAVVTMRCPRSDIYQLLVRISILFYGELIYTGLTRRLPFYFRHLGFSCPNSENPIVFYVSLATIDRETSDRYSETQDQAAKLVEQFRVRSNSLLAEATPFKSNTQGRVASLPLCFARKPGVYSRFNTLVSRNFDAFFRPISLINSLLILPLTTLFLCLFFTKFTSTSWTIPQSSASQIFVFLLHIANTVAMTTLITFSPIRRLSSIEFTHSLYNGGFVIISHLLVSIFFSTVTTFSSTIIFLWFSSVLSRTSLLWTWIIVILIANYSQLQTFLIHLFVRRRHSVVITSVLFNCLLAVAGGGVIKSYSTMDDFIPWISSLSFVNIYRYANYALLALFMPDVRVDGCIRNEKADIDPTPANRFCRWANSSDWISDAFPSSFQPINYTSNCIYASIILAVYLFIVLLLYALPQPRKLHDKFKFR